VHKVLIIGCGAIAGGYDADRPADSGPLTHAAAYRRHGGFELVACVDPDLAQRTAFAARWEVCAAVATIEEAASHGPFDVVSICSPTALHAAHLEAALGLRPKLIFGEKPVTSDLADTQRLVAACADAGILLAINHTRRWAPDIVRLKEELASGQWGAVRAANGVYNKGALNNGAHLIDLLHFLLGDLRLIAVGEPLWDHWTTDPTVPAILAAGEVSCTLGIAHAADYALFELAIITERGVIVMEDGGARWRVRQAVDSPIFRGYRALDRGAWPMGEYDQAMLGAVTEIHEALTQGRSLSSTGRSAARAQEMCTTIIRTALERRKGAGFQT
jgi:predicted dehydrogenase